MAENRDAELKRKKLHTALILVVLVVMVFIATVIFR